jgi:hypothetical protein
MKEMRHDLIRVGRKFRRTIPKGVGEIVVRLNNVRTKPK